MKVVIEIPEETYNFIKENSSGSTVHEAIKNGSPYKSFRCKDCLLDDGKGCILEYYPCIYDAMEYAGKKVKEVKEV